MQATLFSAKVLKACTIKRAYGPNDTFPFGAFKGKKLSVVATIDPQLLEWWQQTKHVEFTQDLKRAIHHAKYLSI